MEPVLDMPTLSQASLITRFVHKIRAWNAIDAMWKINPEFMFPEFKVRRQHIIDYACDEANSAQTGRWDA